MDSKHLDDIVLAVLFASDEALNIKRILSVLDDVSADEVRDAIKRLQASFGAEDSVIRLERVAGGFQLSTSPSFSEYVARLYRGRRKQRLSKAAMETLAIIAYKQPVTRADIENIRGVACGGVVTTLMERSLIRIVGKAKVLGSPFLYGSTQEFLEYLGLNSLKDLPSLEDLEALLAEGAEAESSDENGEPGDDAVVEEAVADDESAEEEDAGEDTTNEHVGDEGGHEDTTDEVVGEELSDDDAADDDQKVNIETDTKLDENRDVGADEEAQVDPPDAVEQPPADGRDADEFVAEPSIDAPTDAEEPDIEPEQTQETEPAEENLAEEKREAGPE